MICTCAREAKLHGEAPGREKVAEPAIEGDEVLVMVEHGCRDPGIGHAGASQRMLLAQGGERWPFGALATEPDVWGVEHRADSGQRMRHRKRIWEDTAIGGQADKSDRDDR